MTDCQMEYMALFPKFERMGGEKWFDKEGWEDGSVVALRGRISALEVVLTAEEIIDCIKEVKKEK